MFLGLGVAKAIMDMHKGFVRASSIGEHIRFYVVLPVTEESKKKRCLEFMIYL